MVMFGFMNLLVVLLCVAVFGFFIVIAAKGISEWSRNNKQDIVTYKATVKAKRQHHQTTHHVPVNDMPATVTSSTDYFVTFQDEYGARQEFRVKDRDYGLLAEGDVGLVSHQGTRFKGFERDRNESGEDFL